MQSTVTRKNSYTLSINVKESGVEFEKAKNQVLEEIRTKGKVNGFKPGSNIPDHVIIKQYGESFIEQQALDALVGKIYPKILKKENIIPAAPGNITEVKSTSPVELTLEVEVFPEIEIDEKKLSKIKVKKSSVSVEEKEVDAELEAIKSRFTHFHEAGHHTDDGADTSNLTVEKGDRATISAQGYDKKGGAAIPETAVPNYPLVIGSGNFIPGFEENLIGGKVGDDMAFDITFPKDYHSPDFQGRKVHFTAKIEKIEKPHTPAFDEDFIEQLRGKRTDLAGLKDILRDEIKVRKESEVRNKDEDVLMKQILEITKFDVGPALISSEIEQIYREHGANLEQQGLSLAQYLEHIKQSPEVYKETVIKPEAERRLKAELILRRIKEMRGTEASDEEIKAEVEKVIAQYGSPEVVERLKAKLVPGDGYYEDIKSRVTYRKVVNEFFE